MGKIHKNFGCLRQLCFFSYLRMEKTVRCYSCSKYSANVNLKFLQGNVIEKSYSQHGS